MRTYNRRAGHDIADGYLRSSTVRAGNTASGLGRFGRLGDSGANTSTQSISAASANGGAVVTTTSPGGSTSSTAPAVTPPSVLKAKIGTAKGAHGFLVWAANALPPQVAKAILQAAIARSISYRSSGGQLGVFGDTSDDDSMSVDSSVLTPDLSTVSPDFDVGSIDLSTVASDAAPTTAWTSAVSTAANTATSTSGLSATLANAVSSLVSTNLARASAGQAPLAVAAGAGIGATAAGSSKTLLWGGAVVGVILLLMVISKK